MSFQCHSLGLELSLGLGARLLFSSQYRKVTGDSQRINQIVTNLISNAKKFTPSGSIFVSAEMFSVSHPPEWAANEELAFDLKSYSDRKGLSRRENTCLDLMHAGVLPNTAGISSSSLLQEERVLLAIAVRDEGIGIAKGNHESIFEMFEQVTACIPQSTRHCWPTTAHMRLCWYADKDL